MLVRAIFAAVLLAANFLSSAGAYAIDANTAVPVDISMVQEAKGAISFQNTYAQPFYSWDKDAPMKSNCNGHCAEIWVPVYPNDRNPSNLGDFTLVTRDDGNKQWAYKGKPLYTFGYGETPPPTDKETQGQWHIVKP